MIASQIKVRKKVSTMNRYSDRTMYMEDATEFARNLATALEEPEAEKLFCPAFKQKSCGCIQRYITGGDDDELLSDESRERALNLLQLHRDAQSHKNYISSESKEKGDKRVLRMIRAEGFENFISENRVHVRRTLGLCERASQKLLMYSNNFLHKDLKTGPEKGPRIQRLGGKRIPKVTLKPISSLAAEGCCKESCVRHSISNYNKVETWRKNSLQSQQMLRKVVQEMLTLDTRKHLCHKFIALVTGCSFALVSKIKEGLKNRGYILPSSNSSSPGKSATNLDVHTALDEEQSLERSDDDILVMSEQSEEADNLSNSGIFHQEVAALNGSQTQYIHEEMKNEAASYQLDSSSISQYLQNRNELWNPLTVDCRAVPAPAVVSVCASVESPSQTKTFTVLGPASTTFPSYEAVAPISEPSVIYMPQAIQGQTFSLFNADTMAEFTGVDPYQNVVILQPAAVNTATYVHE